MSATPHAKSLAERAAALPPSRKLALAAELVDGGHGAAALVIARAAVAEMTVSMIARDLAQAACALPGALPIEHPEYTADPEHPTLAVLVKR